MNENIQYNIHRLDFTVVVMAAVLVTGIILSYIWREWK